MCYIQPTLCHRDESRGSNLWFSQCLSPREPPSLPPSSPYPRCYRFPGGNSNSSILLKTSNPGPWFPPIMMVWNCPDFSALGPVPPHPPPHGHVTWRPASLTGGTEPHSMPLTEHVSGKAFGKPEHVAPSSFYCSASSCALPVPARCLSHPDGGSRCSCAMASTMWVWPQRKTWAIEETEAASLNILFFPTSVNVIPTSNRSCLDLMQHRRKAQAMRPTCWMD